jgi:holo-[acyl-carrier protein] synthase
MVLRLSWHGLGVDVVSVPRFRRLMERWGERALGRLFAPEEGAAGLSYTRLAARFAAKEAVMKALGAGVTSVGWHDIQILSLPSGRPRVQLQGRARELAERLGITRIEISLSHERELAVAVAASFGPGSEEPCS